MANSNSAKVETAFSQRLQALSRSDDECGTFPEKAQAVIPGNIIFNEGTHAFGSAERHGAALTEFGVFWTRP